jgi:hypothetical protein
MTTAQPNQAPQTKKRPPFILFAIGGFIAFCFICFAIGAGMDAAGMLPTMTPAATQTSTPLPTQTFTPAPPTATLEPIQDLQSRIKTSLGTSNRDIERLTEFDWSDSDKSLIIVWSINDNFTQDFIMIGAENDVTEMLKIIAQSGLLPEYQFVTFVGTFPLRDSFGNVTEDRVITASYDKTTVDKINWPNFISSDVFKIADLIGIHPAMTAP